MYLHREKDADFDPILEFCALKPISLDQLQKLQVAAVMQVLSEASCSIIIKLAWCIIVPI